MGISPIFVRLADVGPFTSAFWRVALALPALYVWMKIGERGEPAGATPFSRADHLAGLAFAGDLFFWHLSIVNTSVANATFFATTAPIWVVLFGWLLFRQRVAAAVLAGLGALPGRRRGLARAQLADPSPAARSATLFGARHRRVLRPLFSRRSGGARARLGRPRDFEARA